MTNNATMGHCKDPENHSDKDCCCGGHNHSNPKKNLHHHSTFVKLTRKLVRRFLRIQESTDD